MPGFWGCPWCQGRGCICCEEEADKAYKEAFPNGPIPMATFNINDPTDVELAKKSIGREALEKAFGPGGGGIDEIRRNCEEATAIQTQRKETELC